MTTTILGSGTSSGVPRLSCRCRVCRSQNPRNNRLRPSIWVRDRRSSVVIDTSPDFRYQALRAKIPRIDGVLYTHPHFDHIGGLDELRSYNFIQRERINIYASRWTEREIRRRFDYIFNPKKTEGGGVARLDIRPISIDKPIQIKSLRFIPIEYDHGSRKTLGFRFRDLAYIPDCSSIPKSTARQLQGLSTLLLDCLQIKPHGTHLHLEKALQIAEDLQPRRTFLTHLGHDFDYEKWNKRLPRNVKLAYDGQVIRSR